MTSGVILQRKQYLSTYSGEGTQQDIGHIPGYSKGDLLASKFDYHFLRSEIIYKDIGRRRVVTIGVFL